MKPTPDPSPELVALAMRACAAQEQARTLGDDAFALARSERAGTHSENWAHYTKARIFARVRLREVLASGGKP